MSDATVILLCAISYTVGGMFGMGTLMLLRNARSGVRQERTALETVRILNRG